MFSNRLKSENFVWISNSLEFVKKAHFKVFKSLIELNIHWNKMNKYVESQHQKPKLRVELYIALNLEFILKSKLWSWTILNK